MTGHQPDMKAASLRLLGWYERQRRDLPWRRTRDPYRIWVSEVMLQQTRSETVVPYYERFVARFPELQDLAAAKPEEVLALWSGLGYYGRARQLHRAARQLMARGGKLPATAGELQDLPGVGPYTAAAVASIAFGSPVPVLDGNVRRVLSRVLRLAGDPRSRASTTQLLAAAEELLDPARPGDSNQALMELGARICSPRGPLCCNCPLLVVCRAARVGDAERYPSPRSRRPQVQLRRLVAVAEEAGRVLLVRRADDERILAGLWELPWIELDGDGEDPETRLACRYGGSWKLAPRLRRVRHSVTHRRLEIDVHRCRLAAGGGVGERCEAGWFGVQERARLPMSSLVEKVLRSLD